MPLLGYVGEEAMGRTTVANGKPSLEPADLEAFRMLRTNVEFLNVDRPPQVILVTSALPEEGKSTVSASLAWGSYPLGCRRTCGLRHLPRPPVWAEHPL